MFLMPVFAFERSGSNLIEETQARLAREPNVCCDTFVPQSLKPHRLILRFERAWIQWPVFDSPYNRYSRMIGRFFVAASGMDVFPDEPLKSVEFQHHTGPSFLPPVDFSHHYKFVSKIRTLRQNEQPRLLPSQAKICLFAC